MQYSLNHNCDKFKGYVKKKGQQDFAFNSTFSIITMNEESIEYATENGDTVFKFNYATDHKEIQIKPTNHTLCFYYLSFYTQYLIV